MPPKIEAPWWMLPGLALVVLMIFAGALAAMIAKGNETQITSMVQATIALAIGALGFFFGSSAGSAKKDDALIARQPTTVIVPPAP